MSGGDTGELTGSGGQQFAAILVVCLLAVLGGIFVQIMLKGVNFTSGKVGPIKMKPLLTSIEIPPLVGMIIFGCIARNFLCAEYMDHYPEKYAGWIRSGCLSIILLRGGMELDFKGKGLTVVLLTLLPQNGEAFAVALACRWLFNLPWALALAEGYTLGAVSPAVLVPSCMILHNNDYGTKKGIPTTLIAASSFDDIIAISVFSIFLTVAFNQAPGGPDTSED
jgi:NhaP-type Na+/H+ or K+/H+ antiporter